MLLEFARWFVWILSGYLGVGVVFAVGFTLFGVDRIDPAARDATRGFRVMIAPGAAALWPLLLRRVWVGRPPPEERNAHRLAARKETCG